MNGKRGLIRWTVLLLTLGHRDSREGAVIGEIARDDPGKGAAIGAGVGAVRGARRQATRQQHQQQQAQAQAQQAQAEVEKKKAAYEAQRAQYNKAKKTCLQGRGYTVN